MRAAATTMGFNLRNELIILLPFLRVVLDRIERYHVHVCVTSGDLPMRWKIQVDSRLPAVKLKVMREVVCGPTFVGYTNELSKSYSTLLAERVSADSSKGNLHSMA
jgi:hypothetical protein